MWALSLETKHFLACFFIFVSLFLQTFFKPLLNFFALLPPFSLTNSILECPKLFKSPLLEHKEYNLGSLKSGLRQKYSSLIFRGGAWFGCNMCHYCGAELTGLSNCTEQENGHAFVELNSEHFIESCKLCAEKNYQNTKNQENSSSYTMKSSSSTATLSSSGSSLSSCGDIPVDANFGDRRDVEDSSTDSSIHENHNSSVNGFHVTSKHDAKEISDTESSGPTSSPDDEVDDEFWLPPEPEDSEDDLTGSISNYEDDDDECGDWAKTSSLSNFEDEGSGSYRHKEGKTKAMEDVKNGKFKALVSQLIKSVGIDDHFVDEGENWVDIVTALSWEAAAFVKPDSHEGKAMDPDGYVKIKCVATGSRTQSQLIKGLVFKKHAAHKHMPTKYKNPRLLLIHGSLDLSSGGLSSFESMQQDKDSLKSIVEMIDMYHPNVILVEKSVSRDIQESILAKGITLVFDMKLHRLERVARCIGSPILATEVAIGQKLRQCESFRIEKFVEEHAFSTETGKKQSKTLMFLEGAPSRLGCTILLMGANSDELKRIKCVIRCAVVMAYHLMLETSFLLDQTAMFSTISPSEILDFTLTDEQVTLVRNEAATTFPPNQPDAEKSDTSLTLDIPISNGFHKIELQKLISSPKSNSSLSFNECHPETFPGLSISTSIQKVMNESFPILPDGENGCQTKQAIQISGEEEDRTQSKDEINSVLDSESILVLMSSRNASQGTICEHSHFSHIKFYKSFDVPLGKFLQDNLLNQRLECKTCGEPPEAHFFYYAHHNKQLTIQVRHLPAKKSLPGENEGKLWMWSRCGRCKIHNGSSKSTKRVLISSAARGLSFGKFLELSFSNHSSFNSLSNCGHSFHKDFLYFFGLGPMVAMFKYSTVVTYSVSLPPQRLEFSFTVKEEFLKKDSENVYRKGILMFLEIEKSLMDLKNRYIGATLNIQGSRKEFSDIVDMLKMEKSQFEVEIQNVSKNGGEDDAMSKLLNLNRIRLDLLLESCVWDRRLHALISSDLIVIDSNSLAVDQGTLDEDKKHASELESVLESETKSEEALIDNNDFPVKEIPIDGHNVLTPTTENSHENGSFHDFPIKSTAEENFNTVETNFEQEKVDTPMESDILGCNHGIWAPFSDIRREYMEELQKGHLPKFELCNSYASESTARKVISDEGSRLHIPLGSNNHIVSDYEDEFSSIIACALSLLKDGPSLTENLAEDSSQTLPRAYSLASPHWSSFGSFNSDAVQSPPSNSSGELHSSSFDSLDLLESLVSYGASHPEVSMGSGKNVGTRKYSVVCVYAGEFQKLRDRCCASEVDYIASLSRCRNWDAKGGKSKSFFAKTLDDRFIIKEIKRTEFDSFVKFAGNYFEYMRQCYELGNQTCLAKILGIYQVVIRAKNGKEARHDLLVMENLSFGRQIARQYDLKGALHARLNTAGSDAGDVLLDQNFVNDMNVSPLYVSRKSKRNLQRAVYNDTNFLNSINVMDYSLLVGVDTKNRELVCGIIDYLRQYTWDKQLENWVKSSLVVPKNQLPTIISPKEYKKRFRKFIDTHFLSVPDHWCSRRSSNPCKLCGPTEGNSSFNAKCIERANPDKDTTTTTTTRASQVKNEGGSFKSPPYNNGEQNGFMASQI
ncbi:Putative 1-phosphatidylinositol-3-phosphate 5-kinase FAB1D [Striga hermonthica]|uniref:1-phosphatidylinositol-3-phosphate 5-kinase n=1 Tax=Striga hermonthica TaxID=68872 RepID=A0A9N7NDB1_STRHE|nr:Putative 1-phosphatidylinositol-3-phosphate 5-kinase FAB1D [Striga hermonthica]